jgi:hypothetical protein
MKHGGEVNIEGSIETAGRDYNFVMPIFTYSWSYCSWNVTIECLACRMVDERLIVCGGRIVPLRCPASHDYLEIRGVGSLRYYW